MPVKNTIIATVYYHAPKEYLYSRGKELGLSDEAVDYFKYAEEVPVILTIDKKTGKVLKFEIKQEE